MKKQWIVPLTVLALLVGGAIAGLLAVDAGATAGHDTPPVTSADDIDPGECNLVHNVGACSPEELEEAGIEPVGDGTDGQAPITSADDIDPDECNVVHNIDACSPEEIEQGFPNRPAASQ